MMKSKPTNYKMHALQNVHTSTKRIFCLTLYGIKTFKLIQGSARFLLQQENKDCVILLIRSVGEYKD